MSLSGVLSPPRDVFHHAKPGFARFYSTRFEIFISPRWRERRNKIDVQAVLSMSLGLEGNDVDVLDSQERARFEQLVLPHVDAAFNLARWVMRGRNDAEDVAQDALLRAFRFFRGFHGVDARAWLLQIVRNACYSWLEKNRPLDLSTEFDEMLHTQPGATPESLAIAGDSRARLTRALETLPARFREVLVLRELEGCSYKEIAAITSMPIGTVMSALARAREKLQHTLTQTAPAKSEEASREL